MNRHRIQMCMAAGGLATCTWHVYEARLACTALMSDVRVHEEELAGVLIAV